MPHVFTEGTKANNILLMTEEECELLISDFKGFIVRSRGFREGLIFKDIEDFKQIYKKYFIHSTVYLNKNKPKISQDKLFICNPYIHYINTIQLISNSITREIHKFFKSIDKYLGNIESRHVFIKIKYPELYKTSKDNALIESIMDTAIRTYIGEAYREYIINREKMKQLLHYNKQDMMSIIMNYINYIKGE